MDRPRLNHRCVCARLSSLVDDSRITAFRRKSASRRDYRTRVHSGVWWLMIVVTDHPNEPSARLRSSQLTVFGVYVNTVYHGCTPERATRVGVRRNQQRTMLSRRIATLNCFPRTRDVVFSIPSLPSAFLSPSTLSPHYRRPRLSLRCSALTPTLSSL